MGTANFFNFQGFVLFTQKIKNRKAKRTSSHELHQCLKKMNSYELQNVKHQVASANVFQNK